MENPIDGVVPDFSIFGAEFTEWWQKLFAAAWAIAIIIALFFLVRSIITMASAGENPHDFASGKNSLFKSAGALVLLVAFGVIVGAIISVAG